MIAVQNRIGSNIKRLRATLERFEGGRDILRSPNFESNNIEANRAGRGLSFAHFQHRGGIAGIGHYRQMAQTGDNLAQEFEPLGGKIGGLGRQAGDVAARSRQAWYEAGADRIVRRREHDRDNRCHLLCCKHGPPPTVTITSTLSRTNSAAISPKRSGLPSAQRYSIARVRPSIQPSSRSRSTKAGWRWLSTERVLAPKYPTVGTFPACCARAATGQAAAAPPSSNMNSRRFNLAIIRSPRRRSRAACRVR